jgi:hypothetical protein
MGDIIKEWMLDPDNRTKVFLAFNVGLILTNLLIAVGALVFVLKILGYV